jgi:trk system potassium uptake protein TrkH
VILKPSRDDAKLIGWGIGRVILGVGLLMTVPLAVSLICSEWNVALDFLIGMLCCTAFWLAMELTCKTDRDFGWQHGLIVASGGWLVAMVFGAIPSFLSMHYETFLDACFDLMSGYTTTGLYLLQDLDHLSHGMNMWRHLLTYVGGQGIIVIALTFLFAGTAGAFKIYASEGKEEKLLPNVISTARAIWMISLSYLFVGSALLWIALLREGMPVGRGFLQAVWLFMGSWSTGGFAPQSLNLLYYHSLAIEVITMVIFVIGSLNFALHYAVWTGKVGEIWRNIEVRSFTFTIMLGSVILSIGFAKFGVFTHFSEFFRKGFYILISGHTTTGNSTVYSVSLYREFGFIAMWAVIMVMAIGASACSTGGGFKGLRMGILFRYLRGEVRKLASPESAVVAEKIHHVKDIWLDDPMVKGAMFIIVCYAVTYALGAMLGIMYGYDPNVAIFDAVSAGSNTGLSAGLTSPLMPAAMKVYYIFAMWAGRLEFVSIIALFSFGGASIRGRKGRKG